MLGMVDVEFGDIDVDATPDGLDAAPHLDGVGDDVDRAAALDAGRLVGIEHLDRDVDADDGAFAKPMKSTCIGRSFTASSWKSRGITRCLSPSISTSWMVVRKCPA